MLDDSHYVKIVIEECAGSGRLYFFDLGIDIVHQNVVGSCKIMAFVKDKTT